jgi:hypothetical protein
MLRERVRCGMSGRSGQRRLAGNFLVPAMPHPLILTRCHRNRWEAGWRYRC